MHVQHVQYILFCVQRVLCVHLLNVCLKTRLIAVNVNVRPIVYTAADLYVYHTYALTLSVSAFLLHTAAHTHILFCLCNLICLIVFVG